ncbi:ADP-ribosylglycohydrolase family protein [Yinghuangia aomiensis]
MRDERRETRAPAGRFDERPAASGPPGAPRSDGPRHGSANESDEPSGDAAIDARLPPAGPPDPPPPDGVLRDRIRAGWLGRCAGAEWPAPAPARHPGLVDRHGPVDHAVLTLRLLELHGPGFTHDQMASLWLLTLPFLRPGGDERDAYRNLVDGVVDPAAVPFTPRKRRRSRPRRPVRVHRPGRPAPGRPARPQRRPVVACGRAGCTPRCGSLPSPLPPSRPAVPPRAVSVSLRHVPPHTRLFEALCDVLVARARGREWDDALGEIRAAHERYGARHAIGSASSIAAALLWGDGDWQRCVDLAAAGGGDPETNAAAVGSVAGVLAGTAGLPAEWRHAAADRVRTAVPDAGECRIADLAERTFAVTRAGAR